MTIIISDPAELSAAQLAELYRHVATLQLSDDSADAAGRGVPDRRLRPRSG